VRQKIRLESKDFSAQDESNSGRIGKGIFAKRSETLWLSVVSVVELGNHLAVQQDVSA